jgi:hypothetical protein
VIRKLAFLAPLAFWLVGGAPFAASQTKPNEALLPPTDTEQKQFIEEIKAKAQEFEKSLPDFVCNQLSHHSVDPKGFNQWKTLETISEQLRFVKGQQQYTMLAVNGKKSGENDKPPESAVPVTEFIKMMHDIFDPAAKTGFAWTNWDSVRGHRVHMITFIVPQETSQFTLAKSKGLKTGLAGFVYADTDTNQVVRIVAAPAGIPKNYPIQGVSIDMNYEFTRVGDKVYLLPLKADFRHKEGKGEQVWDEVELKDFRKP